MIEFHELARAELNGAVFWYRSQSREAAVRFFAQVEITLDRIARDPASFPMIGRSSHYVRVARFPFVIVFRLGADRSVTVIAVAHTSRRSGYWRRRR